MIALEYYIDTMEDENRSHLQFPRLPILLAQLVYHTLRLRRLQRRTAKKLIRRATEHSEIFFTTATDLISKLESIDPTSDKIDFSGLIKRAEALIDKLEESRSDVTAYVEENAPSLLVRLGKYNNNIDGIISSLYTFIRGLKKRNLPKKGETSKLAVDLSNYSFHTLLNTMHGGR